MSFGGQIKSFAVKTANNAISQTLDAALTIGKAAIHAVMPDDYEYYLCSLTLYNYKMEKEGFLSFTVMPDNIVENNTPIQNIVKTHAGMVTVFNPTFSPIDINMSGTFGRKFRLLSDYQDPMQGKSGFFGLNFGKIANVNIGMKSGYGMIKILEHILKKSNQLDENRKPYFLIFDNYSFNTSYIVTPTNFSFQQSLETNMIWHYNVSLRATGNKPTNAKSEMGNLLKKVASSSITSGLNNIITKMIGF